MLSVAQPTPEGMPSIRPGIYLLLPLLCGGSIAWMLTMQVVWNLGYPAMLSLFFHVVFVLYVLTLANRLLRRIAPALALTKNELSLIYIALAISSASAQFAEYLVPSLIGPFTLANPNTAFLDQLTGPLVQWFTIRQPDAVRFLNTGNADLWHYFGAWVLPWLGWSFMVTVLLFTTLCTGVLFYRQWADKERLPFPILELPLRLTEYDGRRLTGDKFFLIGFAIAGSLVCWNGFASLYPALPSIPIKRQVYADFSGQGAPLNVFGTVYASFHPFAIGLGYLLPVDLTFSVGACYWLQAIFRYIAASYGMGAGEARFAAVEYQAFGAWMALAVYALWAARAHLKSAWIEAMTGNGQESDGLPFSYRVALFGFLGGISTLCLLGTLLGLSAGAAVIFFLIYFALVTAMARARAELGPPSVDLFFTAPGKAMVAAFGGTAFGTQSLASLSLFYWMSLEYPWHPMGHQLEALRLADRQRIRTFPIGVLLLLIAVLAFMFAFAFVLHLDFSLGAGSARQLESTQIYYGTEAYKMAQNWVTASPPPDAGAIATMAGGAVVTILLSIARLRFLGWPLHPVGYALISAYTTSYLWLPLWIACLAKWLIVRYGGLALFRRFMPFFIGLLLGEFVLGALWALLAVLTGERLYVFWPY